jgi:hypothetical protein
LAKLAPQGIVPVVTAPRIAARSGTRSGACLIGEGGGMEALWTAMDPTLKAGVLQAVATIFAAVFGFGGVIMTIIMQGRHSRRAVAENERRRIRATMYEDAVGICRDLTDASIALSNDLRMLAMQLLAASKAAEVNSDGPLPAARFPALLARYSQFSDAAIKAITLIETRRIIDPRLIVFRTALSTVLHDTREIIHGEFVTWVMPNLPTDNPAGGIFPYEPPILSRAERISRLSDRVIDSLGDATAYAEDILIALQNLLLGDLFMAPVPARRPIDPTKRAVTLDQADALEAWFRATTAWGRVTAQIEADTAARFAPAHGEGLPDVVA